LEPEPTPLLEIFFQVFPHTAKSPINGLADIFFIYPLGFRNICLAHAEYVVGLYPFALRFGQGIERPAQAAGVLPVLDNLAGRQIRMTSLVLNSVPGIQRILRLVAADAPLVGFFISLVGKELRRNLIGNVNIFVMRVPRVKVFQIDRNHNNLHVDLLWMGENQHGVGWGSAARTAAGLVRK